MMEGIKKAKRSPVKIVVALVVISSLVACELWTAMTGMAVLSPSQQESDAWSPPPPPAAASLPLTSEVNSKESSTLPVADKNVLQVPQEDNDEPERHLPTTTVNLPPLLVVASKSKEESPWANLESSGIRRWGCARTETPLIFVHIGKSGGGSIRSRLEASGLNYTKGGKGTTYYPVGNSSAAARFCSSCAPNHMLSTERSMEGSVPCHASTPLGHAIACPNHILGPKIKQSLSDRAHGECGIYSETCHVVYAGHNYIGAEMHWLPGPYLENWWKSQWASPDDEVTSMWNKLKPNQTWCDSHNLEFPKNHTVYNEVYQNCSIPLQQQVDMRATSAVAKKLKLQEDSSLSISSPVYASLPVLRVTLIRNPFSWLMSKYAWHRSKKQTPKCLDFQDAFQAGRPYNISHQAINRLDPGWAWKMSLGYIIYLCGEDCMVRYAAGTATLEDLERQAEQNLRHGFAVVGLLEETDIFYEMISARIGYIDTSLNLHVGGSKHQSLTNEAIDECKAKFSNSSVQETLLQMSPELAALHRLYEVAVEVNRFQLEELRTCSSLPLGRNMTQAGRNVPTTHA
jgi:hypothetical protein